MGAGMLCICELQRHKLTELYVEALCYLRIQGYSVCIFESVEQGIQTCRIVPLQAKKLNQYRRSDKIMDKVSDQVK